MGRRLGLAFRSALAGLMAALPAGACIRATALGASEYTVQLSGNTGHISSAGRLLPRRNVQVVHPVAPLGERIDPAAVAAAIRAHFVAFDLENTDADVALALRWEGHPGYARLRAFAEGVRDGLAPRTARGIPIYLMLDGDVAMTLGGILGNELGIANDILVIDSVQLRDFDYIDLGKIRLPSARAGDDQVAAVQGEPAARALRQLASITMAMIITTIMTIIMSTPTTIIMAETGRHDRWSIAQRSADRPANLGGQWHHRLQRPCQHPLGRRRLDQQRPVCAQAD